MSRRGAFVTPVVRTMLGAAIVLEDLRRRRQGVGVRRVAKESLSEFLPPVRLYREDVEELHHAFSQVADKVVASDGRYLYDTLDELFKEASPDLKTFTMGTDAPRISFSIDNGRRPSLWAVTSDAVSRGVAHRVREIAMRRRLPFRAWLRSSVAAPIVVFTVAILAWVASAVLVEVADGVVIRIVAGVVTLVTGVALWWTIWMATGSRPSRVFLVTRLQRPGFVARNRDALIVGSLTALVGAVVGAIVTLAVTGLLG